MLATYCTILWLQCRYCHTNDLMQAWHRSSGFALLLVCSIIIIITLEMRAGHDTWTLHFTWARGGVVCRNTTHLPSVSIWWSGVLGETDCRWKIEKQSPCNHTVGRCISYSSSSNRYKHSFLWNAWCYLGIWLQSWTMPWVLLINHCQQDHILATLRLNVRLTSKNSFQTLVSTWLTRLYFFISKGFSHHNAHKTQVIWKRGHASLIMLHWCNATQPPPPPRHPPPKKQNKKKPRKRKSLYESH